MLSMDAWGQTVYRCGSAYSQTPCEGGVMMEIQNHNTPEQQTPAQTRAKAARKAAAERAIKQEHLHQGVIAGAEHRLYIQHATKAAAIQARAEADARKAAARAK